MVIQTARVNYKNSYAVKKYSLALRNKIFLKLWVIDSFLRLVILTARVNYKNSGVVAKKFVSAGEKIYLEFVNDSLQRLVRRRRKSTFRRNGLGASISINIKAEFIFFPRPVFTLLIKIIIILRHKNNHNVQ